MRKVEVVPYDPAWPLLFEAEAELLSAIFGAELLHIHHIGSTSIPGLQAKPLEPDECRRPEDYRSYLCPEGIFQGCIFMVHQSEAPGT
jgi:hypothetical protein